MKKPTNSGAAETTLQHLRTAAPGSVLVLEDGDAAMAPSGEGALWDWDAEAVAPSEHCQYCGTGERLFRIDEGRFACGACLHGITSQREASALSPKE